MNKNSKEKTAVKAAKAVVALLAALIVLFSFCLSGCSGNTDPSDDGKTTAKPGPNATEAPAEYSGYIFTYNGTDIKFKVPAADIIASLGTPTSRFESPSCAFGDLDVIYSYPGFDLQTYTEGGVEYTYSVVFWDDSVETNEGLYIGASRADAEAKYGAIGSGETSATFVKGGVKLLILFNGDSVSSIQYFAEV